MIIKAEVTQKIKKKMGNAETETEYEEVKNKRNN